ncbi:matrilin-2-like [Dendronephthya gigantea]|nr:matrilin-2-like [Dendronephthya gigantea]
MQYTEKGSAKMEIDFMNPKEYREIKVRLGTIVQQRGYKRFTGDALVAANHKFYELDAVRQRERNPNVIVLITRGIPNDKEDTRSAARLLGLRQVQLITVGVRSTPSSKFLASFLEEITEKSNVILSKYRGLKKQRFQAIETICSEFEKPVKPGRALSPSLCRRDPQDIYFVIDGSASIKTPNFAKVQIFLMDFISLLRVESSNIHTGLMQYSEERLTSVVWDLGAYTEFETIINIRNMNYQAGTRTATGDALTRVNNEVFTGLYGDRPYIPDMLIIFTDGNAHDLRIARRQAAFLKEKGIFIITIGAGTERSIQKFKQELIDMASGPEYAFTVDFEQLEFFAEKAFPLVCRLLGLMRKKRL